MKRWHSFASVAMAVGAVSIAGLGGSASADARPVPTPPRESARLVVTIDPAKVELWGMSCATSGCLNLALDYCIDEIGGTPITVHEDGGGYTLHCINLQPG